MNQINQTSAATATVVDYTLVYVATVLPVALLVVHCVFSLYYPGPRLPPPPRRV